MQIPSDKPRNAECGALNQEKPQPSSIFSNFKSEMECACGEDQPQRPGGTEEVPGVLRLVEDDTAALRRAREADTFSASDGERAEENSGSKLLQTSIDEAMARSFTFRFLAKAYEYPKADGWAWLSNTTNLSLFLSAVKALPHQDNLLSFRAGELAARLSTEQLDGFTSDYVGAFGHAARGSCPLNEIEYGDLKADPLFQPHRLADLAAFYRAFGVEVADDATERHDHMGVELEFMSILAAKEAYALEHQFDDDRLSQCRDAQKKFLREHLGRWTPAFTRRLARAVGDDALGALAKFTQEFVAADCQCFGVRLGSEDLALRPVDESERLCASCGMGTLPPGALTSTTQI